MIVQINRYAWSNFSQISIVYCKQIECRFGLCIFHQYILLWVFFFVVVVALLSFVIIFHSILTLLFINKKYAQHFICECTSSFSHSHFVFAHCICSSLLQVFTHYLNCYVVLLFELQHHTKCECTDFHVHKLKCNTKRQKYTLKKRQQQKNKKSKEEEKKKLMKTKNYKKKNCMRRINRNASLDSFRMGFQISSTTRVYASFVQLCR